MLFCGYILQNEWHNRKFEIPKVWTLLTVLQFYLTVWRIRNTKWEISVSSKETTATQIKGEKQPSNLTDSVQLISDKFDKYEKDRKATDELIRKLQTQLVGLTDNVSNLSVQVED